jgi:argininosuccinate synthase
VILKAHKSLETLTLTKDVAHFKPVIEKQFAEQTYNGLWFNITSAPGVSYTSRDFIPTKRFST